MTWRDYISLSVGEMKSSFQPLLSQLLPASVYIISIHPQKPHTGRSPKRTNTPEITQTTTIGRSVQVQPANSSLVDWGAGQCFLFLSAEVTTDRNARVVSDNWQWSLASPPSYAHEHTHTQEVDALLWMFPPGVTSERMRISAVSSLFHATAFTTALCPRPG